MFNYLEKFVTGIIGHGTLLTENTKIIGR